MSVKQKLGFGGALATVISSALSLIVVIIVVAIAGDALGGMGIDATVYLLYGVLPGAVTIANLVIGSLMCNKKTSMALGITAICLSVAMIILFIALNYILMGFIGILAILGMIGFLAAIGVTIASLCVKEQKAETAPENTTQG